MATTNAPAQSQPQGSGFSRRVGPFPLWVWVVGVGGVAVYYYRKQQAAAAAAAGTDTTGGLIGSTVTGSPSSIDGSGGTNATAPAATQTLQDWANSALAALAKAGIQPANADKAISDYMNGNALTADEATIVNEALKLAGYPPVTLPFYGSLPNPTPAPTPAPNTHHGSPAPVPAVPGTHVPAASLLNTETFVSQLAGREGVAVPTGSALAALIRRLPGYKPTTDVNASYVDELAAQVGYITSAAHLRAPSWAQINTQAAVIARSNGANFATAPAADRAAYQQQANVQLLEILNPARVSH